MQNKKLELLREFEFIFEIFSPLKGHSQETLCEIIALSFKPKLRSANTFKFLKWPLEKLSFFKLEFSK
jgi:hypothetical protein